MFVDRNDRTLGVTYKNVIPVGSAICRGGTALALASASRKVGEVPRPDDDAEKKQGQHHDHGLLFVFRQVKPGRQQAAREGR